LQSLRAGVRGRGSKELDLGEGLILRADGSVYSVKHGWVVLVVVLVVGWLWIYMVDVDKTA
jgi:hypothetical protein